METTLAHSLPTDERTLVRRAQAGDVEAFGALVSQYMRRAYYAALGLVGSHDDALDLSQEAFSRAFRARMSLDPNRSFYTWLYTILRRLCFNFLRDRKAQSQKLAGAGGWRKAAMNSADSSRDTERAHQLMMGALDDELAEADRSELQRLLDRYPSLQAEWKKLEQLKEVTSTMALRSPPQEIWDTYWTSVYHRFERGVGWVLLSLGAIVSLSYGLWKAAQEILADTTIPGFIKGAILLAIVGAVVLFVSVAREKWFTYRSDPYKDIQR